MRPLRFALANGVLLRDALEALRAIGLDVSRVDGGRQLVVRSGEIEYLLARPSDTATYVERGAADLGIVGKDVLMESGARLLELVDLRFGACRFVVAAPKDALERSLDEYFRKLDGEPPHCIYEMVIAHVERALLTSILDRSNGNQTHAADMLGLNRNTLRAKLAKYKLI